VSDSFKVRLRQAVDTRSERELQEAEAHRCVQQEYDEIQRQKLALINRFNRDVPTLINPIIEAIRIELRGRCQIMPDTPDMRGELPQLGYRLVAVDGTQLQFEMFVIGLRDDGDVFVSIHTHPAVTATHGQELLSAPIERLEQTHLESAMAQYVNYMLGNVPLGGIVD
jgi:hypothetical protein